MAKHKQNIKPIFFVAGSVAWFILATTIMVTTRYQEIIANRVADPRGISTKLESILSILIILFSFIPSGLLLAYPYVKKEFKDNITRRTCLLAIGLTFAFLMPFGAINFAVNFAK